jgi:hypothetical protein
MDRSMTGGPGAATSPFPSLESAPRAAVQPG